MAMPTETVYGLAADALNPEAVASIFLAKERPSWDPLIVHVSDERMLSRLIRPPSRRARRLIDAFWPGPLTLLLERNSLVPDIVTAGRPLVGVRTPAHPVALRLIRAAGLPLAAPSANRFGHISPTTTDHVLADLDGRIDAVLDAGPAEVGVESTVFDPEAMTLYRQGGVSRAGIERLLDASVHVYQAVPEVAHPPASLPSPGVGIRHYAPRARLVLVEDEVELQAELDRSSPMGVGVMLPRDWNVLDWRGSVFSWERWDDPPALARTLYVGLRELDSRGLTTIFCPLLRVRRCAAGRGRFAIGC